MGRLVTNSVWPPKLQEWGRGSYYGSANLQTWLDGMRSVSKTNLIHEAIWKLPAGVCPGRLPSVDHLLNMYPPQCLLLNSPPPGCNSKICAQYKCLYVHPYHSA